MHVLTAGLRALVYGFLVLGPGLAAMPASAQDGPSAAIVDGGPTSSWGYDPTSLQITVGDTVTWTNTGTQPHTVTASDASFDSGYLRPGDTYSQTFTAPGKIQYTCTPHPWMLATITVAATPDSAPDGAGADSSPGADPAGP